MDIEGLMELTTEENRTTLRNLIALKATIGEKYLHQKDAILQNIVVELFDYIDPLKDNLGVNDNSFKVLDAFFLKTLYEKADN